MQRSFGTAELAFGLVDRGDDVFAVGAEVRLGEAGDPLAVAVDGARPDGRARRPSTTQRERSCRHGRHTRRARPRRRPSACRWQGHNRWRARRGVVSSLHHDDSRPRRPARPRGLPLAAGRRPRPAEHQRVAVAAAGRVARRVRGRAVARRLAPLPRSGGDGAARRDRRLARRRPVQVFAANGSNEVIQTLLLTYAGPGRTVATFEPTYQLHAHIARITGSTVVEGERSADFTLDPAEMRRVADRGAAPTSCSCARRTTRPGWSSRPSGCTSCCRSRTGLVVVDEAYAQFADWSALPLVADDAAARRRPDVLEDVEHGGVAARLPRRSGVARRRARQGRAAVPPRRRQADRRPAGVALRRRDGRARAS